MAAALRCGRPAAVRRAAGRRGGRLACSAAGTDVHVVLYTREGCCLCEGLQDKLRGVLDAAAWKGPPELAGAVLLVVDVDEPGFDRHRELTEAVPHVAVRVGADGPDAPIARPQPRAPATRVADALVEALRQSR